MNFFLIILSSLSILTAQEIDIKQLREQFKTEIGFQILKTLQVGINLNNKNFVSQTLEILRSMKSEYTQAEQDDYKDFALRKDECSNEIEELKQKINNFQSNMMFNENNYQKKQKNEVYFNKSIENQMVLKNVQQKIKEIIVAKEEYCYSLEKIIGQSKISKMNFENLLQDFTNLSQNSLLFEEPSQERSDLIDDYIKKMNEFYSPSKVDSYLISMITSVVTNVLHSNEITEERLELVKSQYEYQLEKMQNDLENYESIYNESSDFLEEQKSKVMATIDSIDQKLNSLMEQSQVNSQTNLKSDYSNLSIDNLNNELKLKRQQCEQIRTVYKEHQIKKNKEIELMDYFIVQFSRIPVDSLAEIIKNIDKGGSSSNQGIEL